MCGLYAIKSNYYKVFQQAWSEFTDTKSVFGHVKQRPSTSYWWRKASSKKFEMHERGEYVKLCKHPTFLRTSVAGFCVVLSIRLT